MKNPKLVVAISILASIAFIINSILWFSSGSIIGGIVFAIVAILFALSAFFRIKKFLKREKK
jgi:hypothetical protein